MRTKLQWENKTVVVELLNPDPLKIAIVTDEQRKELDLGSGLSQRKGRLCVDGHQFLPYFVSVSQKGFWVTLGGQTYVFERAKKVGSADASHGGFTAPMPGKIVKVAVSEQEAVTEGTVLVILEAMKMEHRIDAPGAGVVSAVHVQEGQLVDQGMTLLEFVPEE